MIKICHLTIGSSMGLANINLRRYAMTPNNNNS